jgi:ribosomal protein S18 acetylase RimI-like enzyme
MTTQLRIERRDGPGTLDLRGEILAVYGASHADQMHDPWAHPDRFWERLVELYAPAKDFGLVAGWLRDELVGYAFGSPLLSDPIWQDVRKGMPDKTLPSEPQPLYVFREFAVHPAHQRRGYGRALHDALLAGRPELLAYLCVRPDNPAKLAYSSWGWRQVGQLKPFEDSPLFDVMVKELPGGPSHHPR